MSKDKNKGGGEKPATENTATPEPQNEDELLRLKKRKKRLKAKTAAYETLKSAGDANPEIKSALLVLRPSLYGPTQGGGRTAGPAKHLVVTQFIVEKRSASEMDLFKEFKIGRKETGILIRRQLKKAAPDDRAWIEFDDKAEVYNLKGTGANAPDGWGGFVPIEESEDLKALSQGLK